MIGLVFIVSVSVILITMVVGIFAPKWLSLLIPIVFGAWFMVGLQIPNYLGYPIEERYVEGKIGMVMAAAADDDLIYYTVRFQDDNRVRLITVVRDSSEDDAMKRIKEKMDKGPSFVKFGKKGKPKHDGQNGDDSSVETMDIADVPGFAKDTQ